MAIKDSIGDRAWRYMIFYVNTMPSWDLLEIRSAFIGSFDACRYKNDRVRPSITTSSKSAARGFEAALAELPRREAERV